MNNATKTISQILKDNICTVFNLLNVLIAISLCLVGAWKNVLFILIIFINTVVGIVQEIKAKRQVERLTLLSQPSVSVLRNGNEYELTPSEIQKGDILLLESGSVICADCIVSSGKLEVNEAILKGESEPAVKQIGSKLYSGSTVISGKCQAKAICDSADSFTSKMVDEVKKTRKSKSELLSSMKKVTKFTSFLIVPLGLLMFIQAYFFRNAPLDTAIISTSAGLLGMLPKGLVLLINIGLAAGVISLSKKNVLVRELHSLENLAHCDVVCLDKTGTLTEGNLTVESVQTDLDEKEFQKLMLSYIRNTDDNNSTFTAIKSYFDSSNGNSYNVVSTVPFSSERKWSSLMLQDGRTLVIGTSEKLCKSIPPEVSSIMANGKRVIFVGLDRGEFDVSTVTVIAMIVIADKIRKNARQTIKYFYNQSVDVKVISGDNPLSASATARLSGVNNADKYVDVSLLIDDEFESAAKKYTVFGRVTPEQKKRLISVMQKDGHRVAMTGDGVNDLLAMRQADCSAAMGNGSDAAKQTAQLVLLDSDFSVLKNVISEGRRVINNITKSAGVFFIKTIYSVLLYILCLLFNADFPFIPIQITLIDAVIEAFPAFLMSFEKNDKKVDNSFLNSALKSALPNSIAIFLCCTALFFAAPYLGLDAAQTSLIMYLTVGFVSLAGVVKASLPFNLFRGFLAVTSIIGFILAVLLFSSFLQPPQLSAAGAAVLPFVVIPGIVISVFFRLPELKKGKHISNGVAQKNN